MTKFEAVMRGIPRRSPGEATRDAVVNRWLACIDKLDDAAMNVIGEYLIHEAEGRYP